MGRILEWGGVDLEKGGMTPLTNYVLNRVQEKQQKCIFKYAVHDDVTNFEVCGSMENSKNLNILRTKRKFFV